jgi:hypothetical protein
MKVVEYFTRIARRSKHGDFTALSMLGRQDVMQAANAALAETYNALPAYFKELTEGFKLPAPQPITLTVTNGSNMLPSNVFTTDQIGRSVVLPGDPAWNQVLAPNQLLNPYLGASGTVSGTLYGDAVFSTKYPFDRVIGNPTFANRTFGVLAAKQMIRVQQDINWLLWQQSVGIPQCWWPWMLGNSQGNTPLLVLRFAPAPDQDYSINIRMAYWSKRLTLADYSANSTIPVPDQFLESVLVPLALRAFMASPEWLSGPDDTRVIQRAEAALEFARLQVGQVAAPNNKVLTPFGF